MAILIDITGQKFNRLTVLQKEKGSHKGTFWICQCECGAIRILNGRDLKNNHTKSCGCLNSEVAHKRQLKHGESKQTPEYAAWNAMKNRCYNPKYEKFNNYGGRGIKVCDRWLNNFNNFLIDMGRRPSRLHSLDRFPNTNGNYEPSNCRWATQKQQQNNKSNNTILEYNGIKKNLNQWADHLNIHVTTIIRNLHKGKSFQAIVNKFS